jgi:hypothetical protein
MVSFETLGGQRVELADIVLVMLSETAIHGAI